MKVSVESDVLSEALKTLKNLVVSPIVSFKIGKNFTKVMAAEAGNAASVSVPTEIVEKSDNRTFSIDAEKVALAIKGKKIVTLEINQSELLIKGKALQGELLTTQFEPPIIIPDEIKADKGLQVKRDFLELLGKHLPKIELQPLMTTYDFVPLGVRLTENGAFIACFDFYQAAFFYTKDITGDLEFMLPSNLFSLIAREVKGQDYTMSITESAVYAYNDVYEIALGIPQVEGDQVKFEDIRALYKEIKEIESVTLVMKTDKITSLLENVSAVYEKNSTFSLVTKGGKCKLELKSSAGKVSGLIDLEDTPEKDVDLTFDFGFFRALLAKAPPLLTLQVVKDKMLLFKNKPITYMISLV